MQKGSQDNPGFIVVKPLYPTGPAERLFIAGASVFEITEFLPPIQRVTILGINLPNPGTFGPFDNYTAIITASGSVGPLAIFTLIPTEDNRNWAATTFLEFGGTLPEIEVEVRPQSVNGREGEAILRGRVFP